MGEMGEMGDPGAPGDKGDKGDMGDPGSMGTPGQAGSNGAPGQNGSAGVSCWDLNANLTCDVASEDKNADQACTAADCQGPAGSVVTLGQGVGSVFGGNSVTLAPSSGLTLVTGLTLQVVVPATGQYRAIISSDGAAVIAEGEDPASSAVVSVFIQINNQTPVAGGFQNLVLDNEGTGYDKWSFTTTTGTLAAGTHTITLNAANSANSTADVTLSGSTTVNAGLQGSLNVILLKL